MYIHTYVCMHVHTYVSMYIFNTSNTVERSVQMALLVQRGSPFILHSLTCLSSAAEASRGSVGWKATQFTPRSWPWGALRGRKRSERTAQTSGCLKQPVQQTCSSVSPPFTTTLSAQHMQQPTTTLLLCHPPPIPPHFHPHHPTLTTHIPHLHHFTCVHHLSHPLMHTTHPTCTLAPLTHSTFTLTLFLNIH